MNNTQIVESFIDAWNRMDWDAVIDALADDVVYHNIPMAPLNGKDAAAGMILGMQPQSVAWRMVNIAENGNVVLTERVDDFVMGDGKEVSLPVMGTFEIEDGKITAWRDYFDLASFTSQMA
ncbi:MAG: limonene-1,2-epoxide hydrolase family protein [Pseudomonadota bacterium]